MNPKNRLLLISPFPWLRRQIVDWIVPKHNETTLYILSISFIVTIWLSPEFREFVLFMNETSSLLEEIVGYSLPVVGALFAIITAFIPNKFPSFKSVFAPPFILFASLFLAAEYSRIQLDTGNFIGSVFSLYHLLAFYILFLNYDEIEENISINHRACVIKILTATFFTVAVFITTYYLTDWYKISWAVPITMSLFLWQLFENGQKIIRTQ